MKIFFPDIHYALTNYFAKACEKLGHEILVPSKEWKVSFYPKPPINHFVWNESLDEKVLSEKKYNSNVKAISKEQFFDIKPEIIFITAYENQFEIINELWKKQNWSAKLCFYSGNDYWKGAYPLEYLKNYLAADLTGINIAKENGVNYLKYIPYFDESIYKFSGTNDSNTFITAIGEYQKLFSSDFIYYSELQFSTPYINYDLHTKSSHEIVIESIKKSCACLHVKHLEGLGILILESMFIGRPVILFRPFSENKRYKEFCIHGKNSLYFSDKNEYIDIAKKIIFNRDFRHEIQESTAEFTKKILNPQENLYSLNNFLNRLR